MKDVVSKSGEVNAAGAGAPASSETNADANAETNAETNDRPSLFCGLDGTCVNPHDAIPLNTRDTFARNFMSHFAAALGETLHAA